MAHIHLLSTDFDGTLIGHGSDGLCTAAFAEALDHHSRAGAFWAVNTGRSLWHALEGLERFAAPVQPVFIITNEREIYRKAEEEWEAHGGWNEICRRRHEELFAHPESIGIISEIERMLDSLAGASMIYENDLPAGLVTGDEKSMEWIAREIAGFCAAAVPDFHFQRNTIYMRFCHRDYHKGSALAELCRLEGLCADHVFAAGDHFNDLSMLDGRHAAMPACPSNAIEEVKELVFRSGGYVAAQPCADGVAEALGHYAEKKPRPFPAAA